MNNLKRFLLPAVGLILLAGASCTMKQDVYIGKSGSGTVTVDITLADYLTEVIAQVQMLLQPENPITEDQPFFDTEAIQKDFDKREGVSLVSLETPSKNSLKGEFSFEDIETLFQTIEDGSPQDQMIRFSTTNGVSELGVVITRDTVEALLEANPSLNNPLVASFGPTTTQGLSDNDYLDMMEFALGSESRKGIQESTMDLRIKVDGKIISQKGGVIIDSQTVAFSIPVLPFLMLKEPLEYSLSYE